MRLLKLIAQIFLFLSVVNFTFAGVARTQTMDAMRVNLVTGAKEVTERGYTQSKELPERLGRLSTTGNLHSRLDPIVVADAAAEDPESKKFFSKQLNRKLKKYLMLGSMGGVISGITTGFQDEIMGTLSPDAQTVGRSVEPLNELVSRSLSNMGDEDLRMLSIISRRMLTALVRRGASERDTDCR